MNSPGDHGLLGLRHGTVAEDPLQHGDAASHNHVVAYVLHNGRTLACDKGQQHRRLGDAPEQEQLPYGWREGEERGWFYY